MPYLTKEHAKRVRDTIRKEFPLKDGWKISVVNQHLTSFNIGILEGPIEMITYDFKRRNEQVNHYYIKEHYEKFPEIRDILLKIYKIANEGNYTEVVDGDYGNIPNFYVNIEVGRWNLPYKIVNK